MFEFYDSALIWRLFPASFRRVFAQGEVRSGLIVVTDVARDNASKVPVECELVFKRLPGADTSRGSVSSNDNRLGEHFFDS